MVGPENIAQLRYMSLITSTPPHTSLWKRAILSVPVLGWMARDVLYGDPDNIYYLMVILLTVAVVSTAIWGLPALVGLCLTSVPIYFVLLLAVASPWTQAE